MRDITKKSRVMINWYWCPTTTPCVGNLIVVNNNLQVRVAVLNAHEAVQQNLGFTLLPSLRPKVSGPIQFPIRACEQNKLVTLCRPYLDTHHSYRCYSLNALFFTSQPEALESAQLEPYLILRVRSRSGSCP